MNTRNGKKRDWKKKLLHEMINYWFAALYMAIFFGVFNNYRRLILAHYEIVYTNYGISIIRALVLAKVILVAETLHLGRRFEDRPLAVPTLYKTFLFTVCMELFGIVEGLVRGLIRGLGPLEAAGEVIRQYNYEWLAGALVVFFAFIPFFAVRELRRVLGEGTIARLFFQRRSEMEPGHDQASDTLEKL